MKTTPKYVTRTASLAAVCMAALLLATTRTIGFPLITNVVETGGDAEATDTILAKWTGVTWNTTIANEPTPATPIGTPFLVPTFGNHAPTFVDRNNRYTNASATVTIPAYLVGGEYIMSGNDNRDNPAYQLDISVSEPAVIFMLVDNRLTDGANGDPPNFAEGINPSGWTVPMTWLGLGGYQPLTNGLNRTANVTWPDELGIDEGSDGTINNWYSIYWKQVPAGASSIYQPDNGGRNMYGVVVTPAAPHAPTGLSAISLNARVTLFWSASAGATNYIIRRASVSGGPYTPIATNASPSYTDSGLVNFQTYYYVVSAVGLFAEGPNSVQVSGTPKLAPENFTATGGTNQVTLAWSPLAGGDNYTVKRSLVSGGPYTAIASNLSVTSFVDTGLVSGRRYYYTASAALTGGGESANADEAAAVTAPNNLTNVVAQLFAASVVKVGWATLDTVTPTVQIERSTNGVNFTSLAAVTSAPPAFYHTNLPGLTTNYYRLRATNSGGFSAYSSVVSASTPAWGVNVNFANNTNGNTATLAPTPAGFFQDVGFVFDVRGNGQSYGWDIDNTANSRYRQAPNSPDLRYDTFNHLQKQVPSAIWEIAVTNGLYLAHIVSGDATATDSTFQFDVEGFISRALTPAANDWWREFYLTVSVNDGRMTFNSGPTAANNKIAFVDIYPTVPTPNTLTVQPISQTATQNQTVTLSVAVGGGPEPYGFQWYLANNPILGANDATYILQNVQTTDQGTYYCTVTNAGASVTTTNATLNVIPDTFPPVAVSAGSVDGNSIGICFNEYLDPAVAIEVANYLVNGQAGNVAQAALGADQRTVQLTLVTPIAANFAVTVNNLKDLAGNTKPTATLNGGYMGLIAQDIGFPALGGSSFTCDGDTITITGGGADVWGTSDQCHYAAKTVSGNFDARVRVTSLAGANAITKALLMARNTADADSPMFHLSVNPTPPGRDQFEPGARLTVGGGAGLWGSTFVPAGVPNIWLRMTRIGDLWQAYRSANGLDWILSGSITQAAPANLQVGMAVTAHDNLLTATGSFSGFSVSAPVAAPPTLQFQSTSTQLTLNWSGSFWLVEADDVTGPWVTNAAAVSPFTVTPLSGPRKFYGLQPK